MGIHIKQAHLQINVILTSLAIRAQQAISTAPHLAVYMGLAYISAFLVGIVSQI